MLKLEQLIVKQYPNKVFDYTKNNDLLYKHLFGNNLKYIDKKQINNIEELNNKKLDLIFKFIDNIENKTPILNELARCLYFKDSKIILLEKIIEKYYMYILEDTWHYISQKQGFSENFLSRFNFSLNWAYVSIYQNLTENFILKYKDNLIWDLLTRFQEPLSEDLIEKCKNKLGPLAWQNISKYHCLSELFIIKYKKNVNWDNISRYQKLSFEFIKLYFKYLNYKYLIENPSLDKNGLNFIYQKNIYSKFNLLDEEKFRIYCEDGYFRKFRIPIENFPKESCLLPNLFKRKYQAKILDIKSNPRLLIKYLLNWHSDVDWIYISKVCIFNDRDLILLKDHIIWAVYSVLENLSLETIKICEDLINWKYFTLYYPLTFDVIKKFKDKIRWDILDYKPFSDDEFVNEFYDYINWFKFTLTAKLDINKIRKYRNELDWIYINRYCSLGKYVEEFVESGHIKPHQICMHLTKSKEIEMLNWKSKKIYSVVDTSDYIELIRKYKEDINWQWLSYDFKLSEDFMREFKSKLLWRSLDENGLTVNLSEEFIRENQSIILWNRISRCRKLTLNFVREFKYHLDWDEVSLNKSLSLDIISEFRDYLSWQDVSSHSILPEYFIKKFEFYVHWDKISENQILSEKFISENKNLVDWNRISKYQCLTEKFIKKFENNVNWDLIIGNQYLSINFVLEYQKKINIIKLFESFDKIY